MSRLTELIEYYSWKVNELAEGYEIATRYMETGEIKEYNKGCQRIDDTLEALKELQYYKDLEEQGRLIELPCKVGTPIYHIAWEYDKLNDKAYFIGEDTFCIDDLAGWGEYQFLTKEEAEAKLKELKEGVE